MNLYQMLCNSHETKCLGWYCATHTTVVSYVYIYVCIKCMMLMMMSLFISNMQNEDKINKN